MRKLTLLLPLLSLLAGCSVARLPDTSANPFGGAAGTMMALPATRVQLGRTGIKFGPYQTSEVRRGWTNTREGGQVPLRPGASGSAVLDVLNLPYAQRLTTENSKLQFRIQDDQARTAEVYTTTKVVTQAVEARVPLLGQLDPELMSKSTETFNAIIVGPKIGETNAWNLLIATTNRTGFERGNPTPVIGLLGDEDQVLLRLRLVPHGPIITKDGRSLPWPAPSIPGGIEILHEGRRIGYIDYSVARPFLWLRDDLTPELRFLTATTMATVFMKPER